MAAEDDNQIGHDDGLYKTLYFDYEDEVQNHTTAWHGRCNNDTTPICLSRTHPPHTASPRPHAIMHNQ